MFWGSISGLYGKGPALFWEKDWGTITSASYCQHIVPVLGHYIERTKLVLMQDNAKGHSARATLTARYNLVPILWPANSPDLNPIETLWNWIKDYIQVKYGTIHRSYPELQVQVLEAWNSITDEQVKELIKTMRKRCQAGSRLTGQTLEAHYRLPPQPAGFILSVKITSFQFCPSYLVNPISGLLTGDPRSSLPTTSPAGSSYIAGRSGITL